jgi:hypothetical protein
VSGPRIRLHDDTQERLQALAAGLDCFTESDVMVLTGVKHSTLEAWRRNRKGPDYALVGMVYLYPKASVGEFVKAQVREMSRVDMRSVL